MDISRILVPTDFTEHASHALQAAQSLATRFDAKVTLLHVYQVPAYALPEGVIFATADVLSDLHSQLSERLKQTSAKYFPGIEVETQLRSGGAAEEIIEEAKTCGADLIVLATHGRSGLSHLLIGSVAERVVRLSPAPVMTLRPPQDG